MELQDIKSNWNRLSKQVDSLDIKNESLLNEIINNKFKSSLDRMKQTELRYLRISLCCLIYMGFIGVMGLLTMAITIACSIVLSLTVIWQIYRINFLKNINLLSPPIELLGKMKRYKIESRYWFYFGLATIFLMIFLFFIFEQNAPTPTLLGMYIGAGCGLIIGLIFQIRYNKQLNSLVSEMKEITESTK
ncbi:MAG: hypothetical protein ACRC9Q_09825 [Bacteroidales bacterium]